jgi:hypothetical protein
MANLSTTISLTSTGMFPNVTITGKSNLNLSDEGNAFKSIELNPGESQIIYDESRPVGGKEAVLYGYFELPSTALECVDISFYNKSIDPTFSMYSQVIRLMPGDVAFIPFHTSGRAGVRLTAISTSLDNVVPLNFFFGEDSLS